MRYKDSLFSGFTQGHPINTKEAQIPDPKEWDIYQVRDLIKSDTLKKQVEAIRATADDAARRKLKEKLPYVTFGATFSPTRHKDNVIMKSSLIVADLDHIKPENLLATKQKILEDGYTPILMFESPGRGLKVVFLIDRQGEYLDYFFALESYFKKDLSIEIDPSGKDISRACFLSYDPDLFFSEEADFLPMQFIKENPPLLKEKPNQKEKPQKNPDTPAKEKQSKTEPPKILSTPLKMIREAADGEKHTELLKASRLAGGYVKSKGISETNAKKWLYEETCKRDIDNKDNAWKTICDGIENGMKSPLQPPFDPDEYIRVGTDYFKRIGKKDRAGIIQQELKVWKKDTLLLDHGKDNIHKIRKFDDFTIVPNNIKHEPIIDNCYNLYAPFSHIPTPGKWKWIEILLRHVFGEQFDLGIRYFQALYLYPEHILPILAIVSKERGTGKTTFVNFINQVFGNNVSNITPGDLSSQFNGQYLTSNIICIEETSLEKSVTVEKLKDLATKKYASLEYKYANKTRTPFFGKIILTSNFEDKFIRIDQEEIRFFIRKVGVIPKSNLNHANLERDLLNEIPAFLHFLTTLPPINWSTDRSGFTPQELDNIYLQNLKAESRSNVYKRLHMRLEDYFLNELKDHNSFYADVAWLKKQWFDRDHNVEEPYLRKVLQEEFNLKPISKDGKPFYAAMGGVGESKTCRPYLFERMLFTNVPADNITPF